jgi:hypothetical protein
MDWNSKFVVKNIGEARIVTGSISLSCGNSLLVDPTRYPESVINDLKIFKDRKILEVSNELNLLSSYTESSPVSIRTTERADGSTNSHFVFDPNKAIEVSEIDMNSNIKVESLTDMDSGAIQVNYSEIDRVEARDMLNQHWKKVESEINKTNSKRKLNLYLDVAISENIAEKKIEIIKNKISSL